VLSLLHSGTPIFDLFQGMELTTLCAIRTVFGFVILYYFYKGNRRAYFLIELLLLVLVFFIIMLALGFIFYSIFSLNDSNFIFYLITGVLLTIISAAITFKSRFIKDIKIFLEYQRGR